MNRKQSLFLSLDTGNQSLFTTRNTGRRPNYGIITTQSTSSLTPAPATTDLPAPSTMATTAASPAPSLSGKQKKMKSTVPIECGICKNHYDTDDHLPRLLPCLDCICSSCIDQLIETNMKTCPYCRKPFQGSSVEDFHRNNVLVDLMEYVCEQEGKRKTAKPFAEWKEDFRMEFTKENLDKCKQHKSDIQDAIERNKQLILDFSQTNADVQDMSITLQEIMGKNEKQLKVLKERNILLEKKLEEILGNEVKIKEVDDEIKVATGFESIGSTLDKTENFEKEFIKYSEELEDVIAEDTFKHKTTFRELKNTTQKCTTASGILQEIKNKDYEDIFLTAADLQSMSNSVRSIIRKGYLFAVEEFQGQKQYACIKMMSKNKLLLYNLMADCNIPKEAYFIKHSDVLSLLDNSTKRVFMEVNIKEKSESRFIVCLINKGQYAENFFHLCLGNLGHSFAGSKLLSILYEGTNMEQVRSGDYNLNNGQGGKAVVPDVDWRTEKNRDFYKGLNVTTGLVAGVSSCEATVSQFSIFTGNDPTTTVRCPFGMVEEGMNALTKAISQSASGSQLKIKRCGCIIPVVDPRDID